MEVALLRLLAVEVKDSDPDLVAQKGYSLREVRHHGTGGYHI